MLLVSSQPSTLPSPISNDFATPSFPLVGRVAPLDQVPYLNLPQLKNKMFWLKTPEKVQLS